MIAEWFLSDPIPLGMSTDELNTSNAAVTKRRGVVEATATEETAIEKDRNSSDDGKRVKKAALGNRIIVNVEFEGRMREQATAAHARLSTVVFDPMTKKPAGDAVVLFLRE